MVEGAIVWAHHVLWCAHLDLTDVDTCVLGGKPKVADFDDWRVTEIQQSVFQLQIPCSAKLRLRYRLSKSCGKDTA